MSNVFSRTSVTVIDAVPVARLGIRRYLEHHSCYIVKAEFGDITAALEQLSQLQSDIVIVDVPFTGLGELRDFVAAGQGKVIVYSGNRNWEFVESVLNCGCNGFVSKYGPLEDLTTAISAVSDGRQWVSPCVRQLDNGPVLSGSGRSFGLSPRETEIVVMVARGMSSKQIADQLCVGVKTVESHRYRVFRKLGFTNRAQLVNWAIENGFL